MNFWIFFIVFMDYFCGFSLFLYFLRTAWSFSRILEFLSLFECFVDFYIFFSYYLSLTDIFDNNVFVSFLILNNFLFTLESFIVYKGFLKWFVGFQYFFKTGGFQNFQFLSCFEVFWHILWIIVTFLILFQAFNHSIAFIFTLSSPLPSKTFHSHNHEIFPTKLCKQPHLSFAPFHTPSLLSYQTLHSRRI